MRRLLRRWWHALYVNPVDSAQQSIAATGHTPEVSWQGSWITGTQGVEYGALRNERTPGASRI